MREKGQVGTFGEFWNAYRKNGIKAGLKEGVNYLWLQDLVD